ncbi:hypothetical protein AVEN_160511-1 [Araneus ventricosus]|uniref:Uncharacterized protein n=1 Tax=Araneus ventricosus TaxID=182803 RepID=A0A4Y2NZH5_ARAVE|nr:hypothetical protein AVEN_160511-1 [Araneus ventricosus]
MQPKNKAAFCMALLKIKVKRQHPLHGRIHDRLESAREIAHDKYIFLAPLADADGCRCQLVYRFGKALVQQQDSYLSRSCPYRAEYSTWTVNCGIHYCLPNIQATPELKLLLYRSHKPLVLLHSAKNHDNSTPQTRYL